MIRLNRMGAIEPMERFAEMASCLCAGRCTSGSPDASRASGGDHRKDRGGRLGPDGAGSCSGRFGGGCRGGESRLRQRVRLVGPGISVPAKASTVYRLASISKPITATAVMQLVERGKLDLDAPIQKYCPAFPEKRWGITLRQLLGHLGGVRHYGNPGEMRSTRHYTDVVTPLAMFKDDPLLHEPGTAYSYTTFGYNLIGCAVEGASGKSYVEFVRENIFGPAGMDRIRPDDAHAIIPNRAQGYLLRENGDLRNSDLADTSNKIPGGGFASTATDLVKFAIALRNGTLVAESTRIQMWTPQKTSDGNEISYGLGWRISERNGRKEISHGGGQQRVSTLIFLVPAKRVAVALMMDLEGVGGRLPLARRIADLVAE